MSSESQQLCELTPEQASDLDQHLITLAHHLIDLKWAIRTAWKAETYTTTEVREHLFAARVEINQACEVLDSNRFHTADQ